MSTFINPAETEIFHERGWKMTPFPVGGGNTVPAYGYEGCEQPFGVRRARPGKNLKPNFWGVQPYSPHQLEQMYLSKIGVLSYCPFCHHCEGIIPEQLKFLSDRYRRSNVGITFGCNHCQKQKLDNVLFHSIAIAEFQQLNESVAQKYVRTDSKLSAAATNTSANRSSAHC